MSLLAQDYAFVVELINQPPDFNWTYDGDCIVIGVHKFVSINAATNALMHAMKSFMTETFGILLATDESADLPRYTLDATNDGGFMITKHTPGVDGWIMRGTPSETSVLNGRAVIAMHIRPDSSAECCDTTVADTAILEQSLVATTAEKVSLEQDLREVREQLRELAAALQGIMNDKYNKAVIVAPTSPPPHTPLVVDASALAAEISKFDRSTLLSRSQRDRKIQAKNEHAMIDAHLDEKNDIVYEFEDYADKNVDGGDNNEIEWIDDHVSVRSRKSSPISTLIPTPSISPVSSPACSPQDAASELLWPREIKSGDTFDMALNARQSPLYARASDLPYPLSAPGYLANVAFSNSAITNHNIHKYAFRQKYE